MRINKLIASIALAVLVVGAGQAKASTMFEFTYSGTLGADSVSGSGTLFGTDLGGGTFLLTSGHGTSTEAGNLTLMTAGTWINNLAPSVHLISDNLLSPLNNPALNDSGIVFAGSSLPSDSRYFNIWGNGSNNYTYFNNYAGPFPAINLRLDSFTITNVGEGTDVVATPLPAALPLFAGGLGVIGLLARRKKRKAAAAVAAT